MCDVEYTIESRLSREMRQYLHERIFSIFRDFCATTADWENLARLRDCSYRGGHIPDYLQPAIQQLYLLRYFPAYFMEYYFIYLQILREGFLQAPYRIASFGTGSGVDYCGLEFALRERGTSAREAAAYVGYDRVSWMYRETFGNHRCRFFREDITAMEPRWASANLLIFPMSVGEFSDIAWDRVIQMFSQCVFRADRLLLVATLRETSSQLIDIPRMRELAEVLCSSQDFSTEDNVTACEGFGSDRSFAELHAGFAYPRLVRQYLKQLESHCARQACDGVCSNCQSQRQPITRTRYVRYQVLHLQRA